MRIDEVAANPLMTRPEEKVENSSKEEFLRLLVAQLEHQNPLEPQSGAEFVAQLAQFASVEQSEETNTLLGNMHAEQISASSAAMAGFIDKTGTFSTGEMMVDDPSRGLPAVGFELGEGAERLEAVVLDQNGKEVRHIDLGGLPAGEHSLEWDGRDDLGQPVVEGAYHIEVRSEADDGSKTNHSTQISGLIESIDFSNGYPMMRIGGALFAPGDVSSIG